jgi:hypothetical protein
LIESSPSGAEVYENNERLGTTPLALRLKKPSVNVKPRVFELRKDGYQAYHFGQGPADRDTRHVAKLTESATPASASTIPRVPAAARARPPRKTAPKNVPPAPSSERAAPADIKMSR